MNSVGTSEERNQLTAASWAAEGWAGVGGELYVNGKVFTGEGETHFASAFRITDGAFSWVGDSSDVAGGDAVDLRGRTVLPGFLDVHTHPAFMSMLIDAVACLPPAVNDIPELIAALKTHKDFGAGAELMDRRLGLRRIQTGGASETNGAGS